MRQFSEDCERPAAQTETGEMADWDADDFDPDADGKLTAPKATDKWDGEDEDDDIKVR